MSDLDQFLKAHAMMNGGAYVRAHLRRQDRDVWDTLVVGKDLLPLTFWANGEHAPDDDSIVRDEHGNVLTVITATPPGVEPRGLVPTPANANGSPFATMVATVTADGYTPLAAAAEETPFSPPKEKLGPTMLSTLLSTVASQAGENEFSIAEVPTADGGTIRASLDWTGRLLLFWVDMPGDPPPRELMAAVVPEGGDGFSAVTVDQDLRPLYSGSVLAKRLKGE